MKRMAILVVCLFIAAVSSFSATLSELRTTVRLNIRDTSTDSDFQRYSDTDLTSLINEGQREMNNAAWVLETETSYTSVASDMFTDLPSDLLAVLKVTYLKTGSTARTELPEKSQSSLYSSNSNWMNQTGTPTNYVVRPKTDGTLKEIGLYPAPVSTSTGTVYITYAEMPDDLSSASDVPFKGAAWVIPYHRALSDYATARIKQIEGKGDEANVYFQLFAASVNRYRERMGEMPNYTPGMVTGSMNK